MTSVLSTMAGLFLKAGIVMLIINEVRGLILAAPVLYGIYEGGGTAMAVWVGICSLGGILISVLGPLVIFKRLKPRFARS